MYPADARSRRLQARPVVAYIVDTIGVNVTENPLALPAQSPSDRVLADRFRRMSSHDVFALLEKSAHCWLAVAYHVPGSGPSIIVGLVNCRS